ncbi:MAG: hypothetical protein R3D46_01820 [Defluviimonas denitrificans]
MSMIDMRRAGPRQLLGNAVRAAPDGVTYTVDPARIRDHFYQDCSDEIVAYAAPTFAPNRSCRNRRPCRL